ncbi:MAG: hypothetical protein NVV70_16950 [Cellulomonas sp.]|nr:hypothetical protein [Cellulomonas sp.]MCR6649735.1 hypothetical protein [Cellulomonas sp.]
MADATIREVTTTRVEIRLRTPSNWVEVEKALAIARQRLARDGVVLHDDTVTVEADDEGITLWWPKEGSRG